VALMSAVLSCLYRFPVKGLSAQGLPAVTLTPGQGVPEDRRFALFHSAVPAEIDRHGWHPENQFLTLARHQRLAQLDTDYEAESATLTIRRHGRVVARGRIDTPIGRSLIEQFLAAFMAGTIPGPPRLVEVGGIRFGEQQPYQGVTVVSRSTIRDLERVARRSLDPVRFRANLVLDGLPPWQGLKWLGRELTVGAARLRLEAMVEPPAAANVNPASGEHDVNLMQMMEQAYGHRQCVAQARVVAGGLVSVGDAVALVDG